ncbi:MAG: hypothetical protein A2898_00945 [Candidatus Kerfeldbacteria bacterium RIFCSPLOWO2_01_FULL_48_11]|uniref:Phospholipid/glycerol acyltransferase domain-containing protein n=1 Tax=Candidatus Kerfeldbacteria bacterium RIFCSPLOWO2_01_FULL_48_11 TaxID=1798543 RepID=A0A1G2B628_9BACT|nr:MAG: hypothetical protein UY34_C0005G0015 [Parcubacteria group bacterium GW2011_GWA2_48_9]KKW16099.1 MAG: hypothetical protein UY52_C0010G0002 [Parcubacteria group bacterium GW2011_GWC2_49_9]OGY84658.1 MAG: hypothetical protein A2898_00945 [Candidatus Kerfeldbacteria bacterium RIFCSPLOWO2_01_FULL_48_11]HCJ52544.1 hypothetical protein [Candidatus Kerfeldbacteria bacterium]HCM68779.1 hypothetical protein [Candidatus Kerfeldbacteria bacterium]
MIVYPITRVTLFPLCRLLIRSVRGLENIPKRGPFILACHHLGPLDALFIAAVVVPRINQKIHFIASIAPWGPLWKEIVAKRWSGCIPFDKNNRQTCLDTARQYLSEGRVVGIFPVGLLDERESNSSKGKSGTARLALWSKVPVVPVGLISHESVTLGAIIIKHLTRPRIIRISIGEPMTFSDVYDKPITYELLRNVTSRIMQSIDLINKY